MKVKAYAKVNLCLDITGVLPGGYHSLDTVMQEIDLHDVVEIEPDGELTVTCGDVCDEKQNTAYRAAQLFFVYTDIAGGADIRIQKNIPFQAGLGGGSSDAAAVLVALNVLYGTNLTVKELQTIAVKVGADVPFFISGNCARAQGIGERLTPVANKCDFDYLLIKPDCSVDTAQAYTLYDLAEKAVRADTLQVVRTLESGDMQAYCFAAGNVLYPPVLQMQPEIGKVIEAAKHSGADFAMMTGSGSCVFALYTKKDLLEKASLTLQGKYPFVYHAKNIAR